MADKNTNQLVSNNTEYLDLLQNIGTALNNGRQKAVNQVNQAIVETNCILLIQNVRRCRTN